MTVGRVLGGRYQIEALLGSGGMAAVWRGRDLRLDRSVAIKELVGSGLGEPIAMERFDREARTLARLAHPNIVAVHDVGVDGRGRYLVMELIEGWTISAMLADGPLPIAQALAIAAQTCDGLAAAHATGIIHRDVKPANLMLTPAGVVKICDFGIARVLYDTAEASLTGTAFAMGSSKYIAPEQAFGKPVDARADLYALGCTMYTMLAGAVPFSGDNVLEVLHQHLTQPPVPLREHRADIPPPLEALVAQLLAKTPADRPADATEVKRRLVALHEESKAAVVPSSAGTLATAPSAVVLAAIPPSRMAAPLEQASPAAADEAAADGPSGTRPSTVNRRMAGAVLAAALAAILISTLVFWRSLPHGAAGADGSAAALAEASVTTSAGASDTPSAAGPSPTVSLPGGAVPHPSMPIEPSGSAQPDGSVQPSIPPAPVGPIDAMRLSIQELVATGDLKLAGADDVSKKVDDIERLVNAGDIQEAERKIQDTRAKLASLLSDGRLSATGYDILMRDLDRIAAALP